jgi:hypothetical protein
MLRAMCLHLGITFRSEMISWPAGKRDSDGVWGKYWYETVWASTSFAEYKEIPLDLPAAQLAIAEQADPFYQVLYQHRLQA